MSTFNERNLANLVASKPFIHASENEILRYWQSLGNEILSFLENGKYIQIPFLGTFGVGNRNVGVSTYKKTYFFICNKSFLNLNNLRTTGWEPPKKQAVMLDYNSVGSKCGIDQFEAKTIHCEIFASLSELIATRKYDRGNLRMGSLGTLSLKLSYAKTIEFIFSSCAPTPYVTDTMRIPKPYNYNKLVNKDNLYQTKGELVQTMRTKRGMGFNQTDKYLNSNSYNQNDQTLQQSNDFQTPSTYQNTQNEDKINQNIYRKDNIPSISRNNDDDSSPYIQQNNKRSIEENNNQLSPTFNDRNYDTLSVKGKSTGKIPLDLNYEKLETGLDLARRKTDYNTAKLNRLNNKIDEHTREMERTRSQMMDRINEATARVGEIRGYAPNESKYYGRTIADGIDNLGFQASQKYCLSPEERDLRSGYFDLDKTMEDRTKTMTVCRKDFDVTTRKNPTAPYSRWDVKLRCPDCGQMHTMIPHEE